jgi:hypothetical protein
MMFGVRLRGFFAVMLGVHVMGVGEMGMVRRLLAVSALVMLAGFAVMFRGPLVMGRRVFVMLGRALCMSHRCSPSDAPVWRAATLRARGDRRKTDLRRLCERQALANMT